MCYADVERGGPDEVFVPIGGKSDRRIRREWCGDGTYVAEVGWVGRTKLEAAESARVYFRQLRDAGFKDMNTARDRLKQIAGMLKDWKDNNDG